MAPQVQSLSSMARSHLDMGSLDAFDDPATCEKLIESLRPLLGGGSTHIFPAQQMMVNAGNSYLAPMSPEIDHCSTPISTDDIEILDNPAMLNSLDHDMLLSSMGTNSSSMGISYEELSPPLDHAEKWAFSDAEYPMWKLQDFVAPEQSNPLSHGLDSSLEGNQTVGSDAENARLKWGHDSGKQPDTRLDTGLSILIPKRKSVSALDSPVKHGFSRHNSSNDLFKLSDTSDNSDGMDDMEEGLNHSPNGKTPMSKNLVSERRRRKKLNERLYSLRAIVPKISKMDKASIVGDAINYVRDLQKQVEDVHADIVNLQSHPAASDGVIEVDEDVKPPVGLNPSLAQEIQEHKILELEVSKMEEQTYHLRIHCKKGPGVLVQLTRALEALDFEIVNANLTTVSDHILNTIVVKVKNGETMKTEELRKMTLEVVPKFGLHL